MCALSNPISSYCFLEIFWGLIPVSWPGLGLVLWEKAAGGVLHILVVTCSDVGRVGEVRGPSAACSRLLPELCCL